MRFWALASSLLLIAASHGQAKGRFGFSDLPPVPGFRFDLNGFRVADSPSDTFRFETALEGLKPTLITDRVAEYAVTNAKGVDMIRVDLRKPGFEIHFINPIELKLSSLQGPLTTFSAGTFGPGLPTPAVEWAMVTFMDNQPPVLFSFNGEKQEVTVSGTAGDWTLTTSGAPGWVRVCAPRGLQQFRGEDPQQLGQLVQHVTKNVTAFVGPQPQLVGFTLNRQGARLVAEWTFDQAGVWVPPAFIWAKEAGYPLRFNSPIADADAGTEAGPVYYCTTNKLTVDFPCAKPPVGRPILLGLAGPLPAPGDAKDFSQVLANALLLHTSQTRDSDAAAYQAWSRDYTAQNPLNAAGQRADVLAAHAFSWSASALQTGVSSDQNMALTALLWRRDWVGGNLWGSDSAALSRGASLTALACWMSGEEARALDGCLLWAGLMGEKVRPKYMKRIGLKFQAQPMVVAWPDMLHGIYTEPGRQPAWAMLSPLRVVSNGRVFLQRKAGRLVLSWNASQLEPVSMIFSSAKPLQIRPLSNLHMVEAVQIMESGLWRVGYKAKQEGLCEAILEWPDTWPKIPEMGAPPAYQEAPLSRSIL